MDSNRKLTVVAWVDSPVPIIAEQHPPHRYWAPGVMGLIGTLLLHALVLESALLGSRADKRRPPDVQAFGSTPNRSEATPAEALVLISLPNIARTDSDNAQELAAAGAARRETPIALIRPDPSPLIDVGTLALGEEKDSDPSVDSGSGAELARLFGIYSGQIQARVERIWSRPRTSVNDGSNPAKAKDTVEYFHCQVQIVQDSIGNVQEVLLPNCNGSIAWQRSLVMAIQQASPLPAPPSPTVFSRTVSLNFVGYAYVAGASDQDYESLPVETARVILPTKSPEQIAHDFLPFRPIVQEPTR